MRTAARLTEWFEVKVVLHQGSTPSPLLFVNGMNTLNDAFRKDARGICYLQTTSYCVVIQRMKLKTAGKG